MYACLLPLYLNILSLMFWHSLQLGQRAVSIHASSGLRSGGAAAAASCGGGPPAVPGGGVPLAASPPSTGTAGDAACARSRSLACSHFDRSLASRWSACVLWIPPCSCNRCHSVLHRPA